MSSKTLEVPKVIPKLLEEASFSRSPCSPPHQHHEAKKFSGTAFLLHAYQ